MQYLYEQLRETADAQQMTVYCSFCPEWKAEGTAKETRLASEQHREEKHPEVATVKYVRRRRSSFSKSMTEEREAEIEEERRKRMRALGIG